MDVNYFSAIAAKGFLIEFDEEKVFYVFYLS